MKKITLLSVLMVALLLAGCGGGQGSAQNAGVGRVALLVTDAPSDQFDQINVTVTGIELIGGRGRVNVYADPSGVGKTFDLLALSSNSDLFSFAGGVPSGVYSKIRLEVKNIDLVGHDSMGNITTVHPKLPSGKIDLVPHGRFEVVPDQTMYVQLDFDARKAIHIVQAGNSNQYIFRPVIFVDVLGVNYPGRLVHVSGTVGVIDDQARTFTLCNDDYVLRHAEINGVLSRDGHDAYGDHCVTVQAADTAVFFTTAGAVSGFAGLVIGNPVVAIGRFAHAAQASVDNAVLDARVIELGPRSAFPRLKGHVSAINSSDGTVDITLSWMREYHPDVMPMMLPAPPTLAAGITVHVTLDAQTPIFSYTGTPLVLADLQIGQPVKVEGVLDTMTTPAGLKATILQVNTDALIAELSGALNTLNPLQFQLTLDTTGGSTQCVKYDPSTTGLFTVRINGGLSFQPLAYSELLSGMTLNVYGQMDTVDGCFAARHILVTAP
ncbi:MAG: DUF4382 domain-containing protein [Gammaproteobacteria bacterium]|nr:DUF4382 domain-containing protein [Gammaproteobacteria bacterium]